MNERGSDRSDEIHNHHHSRIQTLEKIVLGNGKPDEGLASRVNVMEYQWRLVANLLKLILGCTIPLLLKTVVEVIYLVARK